MADFLKCRVRNYQAIEAGEVNPRLPKLIELADYFGVSVDYLLGRTENTGDQPLTRAGETEVFPAVLVPAFTQEAGPARHSRTCDVPQGRAKTEGIP